MSVEEFAAQLKRHEVYGSFTVASRTLKVILKTVSLNKWRTFSDLVKTLRRVGRELEKAQPVELAVGNMMRRVLKMVREEHQNLMEEGAEESENVHGDQQRPVLVPPSMLRFSMLHLLHHSTAHDDRDADEEVGSYRLKPAVIQGLKDMMMELETMSSNIASQALEHIHSNEMILTCGKSRTVEEFLKNAAKSRQFRIMVVEAGPRNDGQVQATNLAKAGLDVTLIPDSAVFAMMARVNKVIMGSHAVLANGGLIADCTAQIVASAASHYSIPVVVLAGLYKFTPKYPSDLDLFALLSSPAQLLPYHDLYSSFEKPRDVDIVNPSYSYIAPSMVSLFLTNVGVMTDVGGHSPSYIYRILRETYDETDDDLG